MHSWRIDALLLLLALAALLAAPTAEARDTGQDNESDRSSDRQQLLRLHEEILDAHRRNDLDAWMETESDDYVMVSRGEILTPDKAARRQRLGPYLANTTFTTYEDLVPPIVRVSKDGTLGWLVAQVHVVGSQPREDGSPVTFDVVWAWIELFEKRDDRWVRTGNVSNQRPVTSER